MRGGGDTGVPIAGFASFETSALECMLRELTFFLILISGTKFLSRMAVGLQDAVDVARY